MVMVNIINNDEELVIVSKVSAKWFYLMMLDKNER